MSVSGDYSISRVGGRCAGSDEPITPGDRIVTALVEDDEGMRRLDFLERAWDAGARPAAGLMLHGFWRSVAPEPDTPRTALLDNESLLDLFDQLADAHEQRGRVLRYVLALILVRKKQFLYEGSHGKDMLLRRRGDALPPERGGDGPPLIEVADPHMDDAAIAEAIEQVGQVLAGDEA